MKQLVASLLILLSLGVILRAANEDHRLVMGSVYRIAKNLIEVKEEDGGAVAVIRVDASTSYLDSSTAKAAKLKDISVGDQIVIKVAVKDGIDTAEQVRFIPAVAGKKLSSLN
jgi:hypothetical protein